MRKILKILISITIISLFFCLGFNAVKNIHEKNAAVRNIRKLPKFTFQSLANTAYSTDNIVNVDGRIIINLFSPNCEHCQYMAETFLKYKDDLKNMSIIMISHSDSATVSRFYNSYGLKKLPNVVVLKDPMFTFYKIFGTEAIPSFFVYNHQQLVKKIIGETKIENLLQ